MANASVLAALVGVLSLACSSAKQGHAPAQSASTQRQAPLAPGVFHLALLASTPAGARRYLADGGGGCAFEIRIQLPQRVAEASFPLAFAKAALARRPTGNCSSFLENLAGELGFRGRLPTPQWQQELDVTMAILGVNESRATSNPTTAGEFVSDPPGHWMVAKLFLGDGEGEVYLNLNDTDGIGEFSIKDPELATIVVTELAKVLGRK